MRPASVRAGDVLVLSGDIGRHGVAVMAARERLGFEADIESDTAPLATPVLAMLEAVVAVHCLRDLTRSGLASAAVEIAESAGVAIALDEAAIRVRDDVGEACDLLGLDPLHVANEGRFLAFVAPRDADRAVDVPRSSDPSAGSHRRADPNQEVGCHMDV